MITLLRQLRAVASGGGQALPPWDDYWYQRPGFDSAAGMAVSPETAMRLSAVYSCVHVRSETLASCPLVIFKRLPNGGKERATEHPLYKLLHNRPNQWQTSLEWVEMMQAHLDLRGNAFSRILPGPSGPIDQLIPLHPDLVQVFRLPNGRLRYQVRSRFQAEVDNYSQDEIFHLRGLSSDGLVGLSPIAVQSETIGTGLGRQDYEGRQLQNDGKPPFVVQYPGKFRDDSARANYRDSMQKSQTGENRGKVMLLEDGMTAKELGVTNKDSQFLETKNATRVEICGMYRVPPHKIAILERSTNNNIEHQGIEFVTDCVRPMAVRWESRLNTDLIDPISAALGDDEYFAEFLVDGLLRGDMKSRYDAYAIGRNWGWLCPDMICEFEGLNPLPEGKGGQEYLRPLNMVPSGTVYVPPDAEVTPDPAAAPGPGNDDPNNNPPPDTPDDAGNDEAAAARGNLLRAFATEAAGRVVRKEVAALRRTLAKSPQAFNEQAPAFYAEHVDLVAQTMCISHKSAERYVAANLKMVREASEPEDKACVLDWIEDTSAEELSRLALASRGFAFRRLKLEGAKL